MLVIQDYRAVIMRQALRRRSRVAKGQSRAEARNRGLADDVEALRNGLRPGIGQHACRVVPQTRTRASRAWQFLFVAAPFLGPGITAPGNCRRAWLRLFAIWRSGERLQAPRDPASPRRRAFTGVRSARMGPWTRRRSSRAPRWRQAEAPIVSIHPDSTERQARDPPRLRWPGRNQNALA